METEEWRDIPDYEGLYQVSSFGRVKSLYFGKERILKPKKDKCGYLHVILCKNGKRKSFLVHRLVAKCFLEPIKGKDIINHIDENPSNNHVDNLEFCTHEYNMNYGTIKERKSEKMKGKMSGENNPMYGKQHTEETKKKMSESLKKPIQQYTLDMVFICEWDSATDVEKELNLNQSSISKCCKNKRYKSVGGFVWRYKEI